MLDGHLCEMAYSMRIHIISAARRLYSGATAVVLSQGALRASVVKTTLHAIPAFLQSTQRSASHIPKGCRDISALDFRSWDVEPSAL